MDRSGCEEFDRRVLSSTCTWTARSWNNEVDCAVAVFEVDQDHSVEFGCILVVDSIAGCGAIVQSQIDDSASVIALQALEDWQVGIIDRFGNPSVHAIARVIKKVVTDVSFASVEVGGGVSDYRHLHGIIDRPERCTESVRDGGETSARNGRKFRHNDRLSGLGCELDAICVPLSQLDDCSRGCK